MKGLPALVILLLALAAPAISRAGNVRYDPYTPPGGGPARASRPDGAHPAVARIIVPERKSMSLGSGVLLGHTEHLGLVVTNWHVVQDATGTIIVAFPDGFRSAARLLKTDRNWDLAALAVWRPSAQPVPLAAYLPQRGEPLSIAGYGGGSYRMASGRLVGYVAPAAHFPHEMLEVSTSARQGDSGGPIFNARGEVAGILFGTGGGRTIGAWSGRVRNFVLSALDDFQRLEPEPEPEPTAVAQQPIADPEPPVFETSPPPPAPRAPVSQVAATPPRAQAPKPAVRERAKPAPVAAVASKPPPMPMPQTTPKAAPVELVEISPPVASPSEETVTLTWSDLAGTTRAEQTKTVLAAIGVLFLIAWALRLLGEMDGTKRPRAKRAS